VESGGNNAEPELSDKEKELLERIRKMKAPRWRTFGNCRYDWSSWRLSEGGVRTTGTECGQPPVAGSVAVHCGTLKVALRAADGSWQPWRLPVTQEESPEGGGEDRMVASLCANIQPPPAAATPASGKPASSAKPASPAKPAAPGKPGAPPQPAGTQPASPAPAQPKAP
jgi:hypothetical protein